MMEGNADIVIPAKAGIHKPHGFRVPLRGPGMTAMRIPAW